MNEWMNERVQDLSTSSLIKALEANINAQIPLRKVVVGERESQRRSGKQVEVELRC